MTLHRFGSTVVLLAWVCWCGGCASAPAAGPRRPLTGDALAQVHRDITEAHARLDLVAAREAAADGRWNDCETLARQAYASQEYKAEAGRLLGEALGNQRRFREQLDVYRQVRALDPDAIPDAEYVEALVGVIGKTRYRRADRRLNLRLQVARLDPSNPAGSLKAIRQDMASAIDEAYQHRQWKQLRSLTEALRTSPPPPGEALAASTTLGVDWMHAIALYEIGEKARARRELGRLMAPERVRSMSLMGLARLAEFFEDIGEHAQILRLYDVALADASMPHSRRRQRLLYIFATYLLHANVPANKRWGEAILREYVAVGTSPQIAKPDAWLANQRRQVFRRAYQLASGSGLDALAGELFTESIMNGTLSQYDAEAYFRSLVFAQKLAQAHSLLDKYLRGHPGVRSLRDVAEWAIRAHQWKWAFAYTNKALRQKPGNVELWLDLARVAAKANDKTALKRAARQLGRMKGLSDSDTARAVDIFQTAGMSGRVVALLERRHRRLPGNVNATFALVKGLVKAGHKRRAKAVLLETARHTSGDYYSLSSLASLASAQLDDATALQVYLTAGDKLDARTRIAAAEVAIMSGDLDTFDRLVGQIEHGNPNPEDLYTLWGVVSHTPHDKRRFEVLEALINSVGHTRFPQLRTTLLRHYLKVGRTADAFALWDADRAMSVADAMYEMRHYTVSVDVASRRALLAEYHKRHPHDEVSAAVLLKVGEMYRQAGRDVAREPGNGPEADKLRAKARDYFARCLSKSAAANKSLLELAGFFDRDGFDGLAEHAYLASARLNPHSAEAWLDYAKFLLAHGRYEAANQVFVRYVQEGRATRAESSMIAAKTLAADGDHVHAEAFFRATLHYANHHKLSKSEQRRILIEVGRGLGSIYLDDGRVEDFLELTSDYYAKYTGRHPYLKATDRRIDLDGLSSHGLLAQFVARLDRLAPESAVVRNHRDQYARALWAVGRRRDAWTQFQKSVSPGYGSGYRWLKIARFLDSHGGHKLAATACDRAVRNSKGYGSVSALARRAMFLVRQGHFEAAIADYFAAARAGLRSKYAYRAMLEEFAAVGQETLARAAALRDDSPFKSLAKQQRPSQGVPTGSAAELVRWADHQVSAGAQWLDVGDALLGAGRFGALAAVINARLDKGDNDTAADLAWTARDGLARIDALAPIIERLKGHVARSKSKYLAELLFEEELRAGHPAKALSVLERTGLARTEARASLSLVVGRQSGPDAGLTRLLARRHRYRYFAHLPMNLEFLRLGGDQAMESLLEQVVPLMAANSRLAVAYTNLLLRTRGVGHALAFLRSLLAYASTTPSNHLQRVDPMRDVARGLALLYSAGYTDEVHAFVMTLDTSARRGAGMRRLISNVAPEAKPADEHGASSHSTRVGDAVARADRLIAAGEYERARAVLDGVTHAAVGRGHARSVRARPALVVEWVKFYAESGDERGLRRLLDHWQERAAWHPDAVRSLIGALKANGYFEQAARVARDRAERTPTDHAIETALAESARVGDRDSVERLLPRYWRQVGERGQRFGRINYIKDIAMSFDPDIARVMLQPYVDAAPAVYGPRVAQIIVSVRAGDGAATRKAIARFVERYGAEQRAVDLLVDALDRQRAFMEIVRYLAPKVQASGLSAAAVRTVARAHLEVGFVDRAMHFLDALVERAANREAQAATLAYDLAVDGYPQAAARLVRRAFKEGGKLPASWLARGLVGLSTNSPTAAKDLAHGVAPRVGDAQLLQDIATVALRARRFDIARTYLTRLLALPGRSFRVQEHPLARAIVAIREAGQARWGVRFLDKAVPGLLDAGYFVNSPRWSLLIGSLLTQAHLLHRADRWYAQSVAYSRLTGTQTLYLPMMLSRRALNQAVNGGDAKRALRWAQQAQKSTFGTDSSVLVCLAIAAYKNGDVDRATKAYRMAKRFGFDDQRNFVPVAEHLAQLAARGSTSVDPPGGVSRLLGRRTLQFVPQGLLSGSNSHLRPYQPQRHHYYTF